MVRELSRLPAGFVTRSPPKLALIVRTTTSMPTGPHADDCGTIESDDRFGQAASVALARTKPLPRRPATPCGNSETATNTAPHSA